MSWDNWGPNEPNGKEGEIFWRNEGWFIFVSRIIYQTNLFKYIRYQIKCEQ